MCFNASWATGKTCLRWSFAVAFVCCFDWSASLTVMLNMEIAMQITAKTCVKLLGVLRALDRGADDT